jgi:hypothetical protein
MDSTSAVPAVPPAVPGSRYLGAGRHAVLEEFR